jgi:uncharacterized protein (DUF983 family)
MLIPKGNLLYSVTHLKCPRCNEGNLFSNANPYRLSQVVDMPETCPHCHLKYEKETGFFYGAMYVSYALNVAFAVSLFVAYYVLAWSLSLHFYLIALVSLTLLLFPYFMRISRAIWINFFVKFDKSYCEKNFKAPSHKAS